MLTTRMLRRRIPNGLLHTTMVFILLLATPLLSPRSASADALLVNVPTGNNPGSVAVNPVTNKIYVLNSLDGTMTVIDGASNLATATVAVGLRPNGMAVNTVTNKIYVSNTDRDIVTVIDGDTNDVTSTINVGDGPSAIAVNEITNKIYVLNWIGNSVTVIDGVSNATKTVTTGSGPHGLTVNPVANKIYIANYGSFSLTVIDGATDSITKTWPVGSNPHNVAVNPATNMVYVANYGSGNVTVIDEWNNTSKVIAAGSGSHQIKVNLVTNKIYVANLSGSVTVIDGQAETTETIALGGALSRLAINENTNKIYVVNNNDNSVTVINGENNETATIATGQGPNSVAVNPVTNKIYVANFNSNHVSIIYGESLPTISVTNASFDKKVGAATNADVTTTVAVYGSVLSSISNDAATLVSGTDYTYDLISGAVTINKSYLSAQSNGTVDLTFHFSIGTTQTLAIEVGDTTPIPTPIPMLSNLTIDHGTLSPSFLSSEPNYNVKVSNSITSLNLKLTLADPTQQLTVAGATYHSVAGTVHTYIASNLRVGSNPIQIDVTAQDSTVNPYKLTVERAAPASNGSVGGTIPTTPVTAIDGQLTLPPGRAGEVSLGDGILISVPAGASSKELTLTIQKVLDMQKLRPNKEVLASSVYEFFGEFPDKLEKPVTLTLSFDPAKVKSNQTVAVFYYDEVAKAWVKVPGGQINENRVSVEIDHFRKYYAVLVIDKTSGLPVKEQPMDTNTEIHFSDIAGHWAEASIKQAVNDGIVKGYPDGTFKPNATVTRAEFAVMLMSALKLNGAVAKLTFKDAANIGVWAQKAVAQAVQAGIDKGYGDGTFRPTEMVTRSEMAEMIANALKLPMELNTSTDFEDDRDIPSWAKAEVGALEQLGIVQGTGSNKFNPNAQTTRAEAVTVLLKMLMHMKK